jgi:diguanylate cyclase (GGDEF)-like protein/PAS domain S-box-containing protein
MAAVDDMVLSAPVVGQLTGALVVIAAYPVKDSDGRLVGAVTAPLDLSALASLLGESHLPPGTHTRLVNEEGYVVTSYPPGDSVGHKGRAASRSAFVTRSGTSTETGADGVERFYAFVPVKGTGWVALAGVLTEWALADYRRQRNQTLAAVLAVLALGGSLAVGIAQRISRPIRALHKDAQARAGALIADRPRVHGHDEIRQLAETFSEMARSVETHEADRRQVGEQLRESERRFRDLLENVQLASVMLDLEGRITYCNQYLLRLAGWQQGEVLGRDWFETFMPPALGDMRPVFSDLLRNAPSAWHRDQEIVTRSGERRLFRWSNSVLRSPEGDVIGTASIGEDITEQKRAEIAVKHLNRVYAMLSGINALIVRVRDRGELFAEACRIAVEAGGFRMSLISIVDPATKRLVTVASSGKDPELLASIEAVLSGAKSETTLLARVIREKAAFVSNDSQNDPALVFGGRYADQGVRSIAILPLIVAEAAVGTIALYASEADFFHADEMELLAGLAADVAFAIDHLDKLGLVDYLAFYDVLTGLANRRLLLDRLEQATRAATDPAHPLALLLLDLDRFKNLNDTLGRRAGDALLRQVAQWLTRTFGDASRVARVGGDAFAVMLPGTGEMDAERLVETTIEDFMNHPFTLDGGVFRVAAKAGVSLFPQDGADAESLFTNAEAALKKAKAGGERYLLYTARMTEATAAKLTLENQLRQALDKGEFVLHYQPKVSLGNGRVTGAEALIRWNHPLTGLVPPAQFIPVLEETGLIHAVGRWALREAISDYLRWRSAGLPAVRIAVNISPPQLRGRRFIAEVRQVVDVDARALEGLELEIAEGVIMEDIMHSIATLDAVRAMGVTVAIDDFGTGFSALSHLARLPADTLKIDRSFVAGMTAGPQGLALVSTIIKLAHSLKLKVVAEGVETDEQSRLLRLLDCDEAQGFFVGLPIPVEDFESSWLVTTVHPAHA